MISVVKSLGLGILAGVALTFLADALHYNFFVLLGVYFAGGLVALILFQDSPAK